MPEEDKIIPLGTLDTVTVTGVNLKKQRENKAKLLAVPGAYYYENVRYWRDAMAYMRVIGDRDAEQKIYMKRFVYSRDKATAGVLALTGGFIVAGFAPGALAGISASPTALYLAGKCSQMGKMGFQLYNSSVAIRMGINATTQAITEDDGWRGVNLVSIASEAVPFGISRWGLVNMLSTTAEYKPFSEKEEKIFKFTGYNKSFSETFFDIGVQALTTGFDKRISGFVNNNIGNTLKDRTERRLIQYLAAPIYLSGYNLSHRAITVKIKDKHGIGKTTK